MYIYICNMYMCIYIYIHVYTPCMYTYIRMYMYMCIYICTYVSMYMYIFIYLSQEQCFNEVWKISAAIAPEMHPLPGRPGQARLPRKLPTSPGQAITCRLLCSSFLVMTGLCYLEL